MFSSFLFSSQIKSQLGSNMHLTAVNSFFNKKTGRNNGEDSLSERDESQAGITNGEESWLMLCQGKWPTHGSKHKSLNFNAFELI